MKSTLVTVGTSADALSFTPAAPIAAPVGMLADIGAAGISLVQGEFRESFWSVIAVVPIFGSIGRVGGRIDKVQGATKAVDRATDLGRGAARGAGRTGSRAVDAALDATGKVHGKLPDVRDLGRYDVNELARLRGELTQSVQKRVEVTVQKGSDFGHGERLAAEQQLIKSIEKHLRDR